MIRSLSLEVSGTDRFPVIDVARCSSSGGLQFRTPTLEELRFVYAAMKAISLVHPLLQQDNGAGPKWSRVVYFEPFIETVDVQWPSEMSKGNDLVAVTVSHPPGQGYEEKAISTANSTPAKYAEPPKEETFVDVKVSSSVGLRHCEMCEKEVHGEQSVCCNWCPGVPMNLSGTTSGISSRVRVNLVRGLYQEEATYLSSPHVVIALNCGLEKYASWGGALNLIKSMGVPAFFTDQSELSCANAKQVLRTAGLHITQPVTPNPFRSPVRNNGPSSNLPSYSNGFVFGVNT